jgi:predicted dehydrogenase
MKGGWPVKAQALGGRHYRINPDGEPYIDQNLDSYSVEYTFADGAKLLMDGRCMYGCADIYSSYVHGSKGMAIAAKSGDCQPPSSIFKGQSIQRSNLVWTSKPVPGQGDPYQNEWDELIDAIRNNKPYNEAKRGVEASITSNLGRMAAHTGQEVTFEEALNAEQEMAPGIENWTMDSAPPVKSDKDGKYPVPMPGITKNREY